MTFYLPDKAASDPAVVDLVLAWVTSENWGDSRKFLSDNAEALLGADAHAALEQLVEKNPDQEVLGLHAELLEAARVGGIDTAYEAIDESIMRFALAEILVNWVSTQSWDDARAFFDEHAEEFLTDEAESVLDELVDDNPGQPDLLAHQGLLELIRLDGPDAAFSVLNDPEALGDFVTSSANQADPTRAVPRARLLAGLYPDNIGAQMALATTALIQGDRNEALRAIARSAQSLPKADRELLAEALTNLADTQPELAAGLMMLKEELSG
jgi:tetratricopeptide (TPR) repeat protein